jgi:endonuclease/exonuclease/phosphatase family metal-dependent hydrolase
MRAFYVPHAPEARLQLRVLTWNLAGLFDALLDERSEAACFAALLRQPPPDVVLLQEVVRRSWHGHLRHHFRAAGYTPVPLDPTATPHSYFALAFVGPRLEIVASEVRELPTRMGRSLVVVDALADGRPIRLATAHLESLSGGRRERRLQLEEVVRALTEVEGPAVFGGDTNLRDPELSGFDFQGIEDAWEALGRPADRAVTWVHPDGKARARYDRFYLRGLRVESMELVGDRPFGEGRERPSDHVGVEISVREA